ncbi:MAG: hypothetical protein ACTSSP_01590 [Candidatus Asgardarchaeia archaeon]
MYFSAGDSKENNPLDPKRLADLKFYLEITPIHLKIFEALLDCDWHEVEDVFRVVSENSLTVTRTMIGIILGELQNILTSDLLESKFGSETYSWRLNPTFKDFFQKIAKEVSNNIVTTKRKF